MNAINSETYSFASFDTFAVGGIDRFMIQLIFAIGRYRSCSCPSIQMPLGASVYLQKRVRGLECAATRQEVESCSKHGNKWIYTASVLMSSCAQIKELTHTSTNSLPQRIHRAVNSHINEFTPTTNNRATIQGSKNTMPIVELTLLVLNLQKPA